MVYKYVYLRVVAIMLAFLIAIECMVNIIHIGGIMAHNQLLHVRL